MLRLPLLSLALSLFASTCVLADRDYIIRNSCPTAVGLFINGVAQGPLASGGITSRTFNNTFSGFIYTDVSGGNQNGTGTTRAGFFGDSSYYYMVVDRSNFNVGMTITPLDRVPQGGFCVSASCTTGTCPTAFQSPPTAFPPSTTTPPTPPLFQCQQPDTGYIVEFCPGGGFPSEPVPTVTIHPNGNNAKCLDVRGAVLANGTAVQIFDCNGTGAQRWQIQRGNTQVRLEGTIFCLDAGSAPANGVGMKIWTCFTHLPAQAWFYTNDNRIAVTGTGQCLDLTNGVLTNSNQVQTWQCTDNNLNQVWTTTAAT